jgi:hypothetical protein
LAHDVDEKVKVPSEIDELSALGPEATEPAAQAAEDELMDVAALAALSKAGRRGGVDVEAKLAADSGSVAGVRAQAPLGAPAIAAAVGGRGAAVGGRAGDSHAGRRWWLPLAIGIGVGAALSALVFSLKPASAPSASAASSESSQALRQPDPNAGAPRQQAREATATGVVPAQPSAAEAIGVGQPPGTEPGIGQPGIGQPGVGQPGLATPPAVGQTGAATQPGVGQPGAANRPGVAQPGVGQPPSAAAQSRGVSPSNAAAPAAQRAAAESGAARPPPSAAPQTDAHHGAATPTPGTASNAARAPGAAPDSEEARLAAADHHGSSDSPLDAVLDDAFTQHGQQRTAAVAALPLAPNRDDVIKAMTVLVPAIRGCAQGQSGLATAALVVRNDGRVESVSVSGQPFEGAASGRCMEGVVRRARFPHFQQPSFRVQFPFSIQ